MDTKSIFEKSFSNEALSGLMSGLIFRIAFDGETSSFQLRKAK